MSVSACGACCAAPENSAHALEPSADAPDLIYLSVPSMHCAGCIAATERTLRAQPGVIEARANLSLHRITVSTARPGLTEDLIEALAQAGFEAFALDGAVVAQDQDPEGRALLLRLGIAGFAMMNVMLLSIAVWSGAEGATRDMFHWVSAVIALPTGLFAATPFFKNALEALRHARLNMDVPISLAIILAIGMSLVETFAGGAHAYFDAALSLSFFLLAGRYLDHRTRRAARSAAVELTALDVPTAMVRRAEAWVEIPARDLKPGDLVRIAPGARVPGDGEIISGRSEFDRSLLTGETVPEAAGPGDVLHAGETNLTGLIEMRIAASGDATMLAQMRELIANAEASRNRYSALADRAARIYAPLVHLLAFTAFLFWVSWDGDVRHAINIAVAVLIITCPCALGLAVPAVMVAANGRLFCAGVLVKDATALERLAEVEHVVFDKTGTLTEGQPELIGDYDPQDHALAGALASASLHPLSQALAASAPGWTGAVLTDIQEIPGQGIAARLEGAEIRLGRAAFVGASAGEGMESWLSVDGRLTRFAFTDRPASWAAPMLRLLDRLGLGQMLLSGDRPGAVAQTAQVLGMHTARGGVAPADKLEVVRALDGPALMVGDGLNDTVALAGAHVSAAPARATDLARAKSDILFFRNRLDSLPGTIEVARTAKRRILQNFALAATYNIIAIPLAFSGLATPLMAALAMSTSSILVSLNALRLPKVMPSQS